MKRFQADQIQKSCKCNQSCVEESNCLLVGGGAI